MSSHKVDPTKISQVEHLVGQKNKTREVLAREIGITKETLINFIKGRPVRADIFTDICDFLEIDWKTVAEEIPNRTTINNVPLSGAKRFVGRTELINSIHTLINDDNCPNIVSITGMGGLGKSELAIQYAKRNLQAYPDGVCWVRARQEDAPGQASIANQILSFAYRLGVSITHRDRDKDKDDNLPNLVQQIYDQWKGQSEVLILFDDVESYSYISDYLPRDSRFKVIITTRLNLSSNESIHSISLEVLSLADSLELLGVFASQERINAELTSSSELCTFLGCLPLALELIGRYLESNLGVKVATVLSELEELAKKRRTIGYSAFDGSRTSNPAWNLTAERGLEAAFDLTWIKLSENTRILALFLGRFPTTEIHWEHVEGVKEIQAELNPELGEYDQDELRRERDELSTYSLVKANLEGLYCLHPMTRQYFRYRITDKEYEQFGDIL